MIRSILASKLSVPLNEIKLRDEEYFWLSYPETRNKFILDKTTYNTKTLDFQKYQEENVDELQGQFWEGIQDSSVNEDSSHEEWAAWEVKLRHICGELIRVDTLRLAALGNITIPDL